MTVQYSCQQFSFQSIIIIFLTQARYNRHLLLHYKVNYFYVSILHIYNIKYFYTIDNLHIQML